jgi:hypothetical protein
VARVHWLMDGLHLRDLYAKMPVISRRNIAFLTCLGHLGQCNTDRIVSISGHVAQGGQGKYCFMSLSLVTTSALSHNLRQCKYGLSLLTKTSVIMQIGLSIPTCLGYTHQLSLSHYGDYRSNLEHFITHFFLYLKKLS